MIANTEPNKWQNRNGTSRSYPVMLFCKLYHKAKAEGVPMTVLANRLVEKALGSEKQINTEREVENRNLTEPN
jgi:hypothetical protein